MAYKYTKYRSGPILAGILGILLLSLLDGCGPKDIHTIGSGVTPTSGEISKEDLREQLDTLREFFKTKLRQAANELNERLPTAKTEKMTLQMRARMLQGLNAALDHDDPIVAFIETWALCTRFRIYLEEGEGSSLYGEAQEFALNSAKRIEAEIERIGHAFLKDDVFETTRKNVTVFANNNPIRTAFSNVTVYATALQRDQANPFMSVLKLPMTPFRAMEGVDRTASAVHQLRDTAERFSDIVAELPESSRWQLQLLLFDLQETEMTKSFLDSLKQLSESSTRLEKSTEQLPEQLREELTQFVNDVDRKQAGLQKTLLQAEKTTIAVNNALEKLDEAASSLDAVAKNVTETAQAWETAAKATGEAAREFKKDKPSPKGTPSFNITEYRQAAEQTSQAANDIKVLLASIEDFSMSGHYGSIVNHLALRVAGLIVLIFVLVVLYRIIATRLTRAKGGKSA
jgi:hypothetical protein